MDSNCSNCSNCNPGATASEISYYSNLSIDELRPERVIVFAGSNDISGFYQSTSSVNEYEVVNNILNIACNAKMLERKAFIYQLFCQGVDMNLKT